MGKGRRRLQAKFGTCPVFVSEKVRYYNRNVADFDRGVLQTKFPNFVFAVFKCRVCKRWHVGRRRESGEYAEVESK
jgi:hypothetical protein